MEARWRPRWKARSPHLGDARGLPGPGPWEGPGGRPVGGLGRGLERPGGLGDLGGGLGGGLGDDL